MVSAVGAIGAAEGFVRKFSRPRHSNALAILGDSRVGNGYGNNMYAVGQGRSFAQWASLLSGGRFWICNASGIGGYKTDQVEDIILPRFLAGIAGGVDPAWGTSTFVKPGYCYLVCATNDIGALGQTNTRGQTITIATTLANIKSMALKLLDAGIVPILHVETPRNDPTNIIKYNYCLVALANSLGVPYVDAFGALVDVRLNAPACMKGQYAGRLSAGTLSANPFATTSGSSIVAVTETAHNLATGQTAYFSGATAVAGLTISGQYTLTVVNANSYTIDAGANANATTTGGGSTVKNFHEDVVHPGAAGAKAWGQALCDVMLRLVGSQQPPLKVQGGTALWANSLFLTDSNADGFPDSWTNSLGANATSLLTTDAAVSGGVWQITATAEAGGFVASPAFGSNTIAAGNWVAFFYKAKFTGAGVTPSWGGWLKQYQGTAYTFIGFVPAAGSVTTPSTGDGILPDTGGWVDFFSIQQMPPGGTGNVQAQFSISGAGSVLQIAQCGAIDLTGAGFTPP